MIIDLHIHTYFSDGEFSPEEVILEAKKNKIKTFSITDHNTIKYNDKFIKITKENGINYIPGIEISTISRQPSNNLSLHVLGYGKKLNIEVIEKKLQGTIDGYNDRAKKIIDKLNLIFPSLEMNFQSIKEKNNEAYISRNTIAKLLVEYIKNISIKDALKQYVFIEEDDSWMIETEECFQLIANSGGIPVLAHSGRELRKIGQSSYEQMIKKFVNAGLQGLEVYYPKHTKEEIQTIKDIAKKYNLLITGGSDWHGPSFNPDIRLGINIQEQDIKPFLDKINKLN